MLFLSLGMSTAHELTRRDRMAQFGLETTTRFKRTTLVGTMSQTGYGSTFQCEYPIVELLSSLSSRSAEELASLLRRQAHKVSSSCSRLQLIFELIPSTANDDDQSAEDLVRVFISGSGSLLTI